MEVVDRIFLCCEVARGFLYMLSNM